MQLPVAASLTALARRGRTSPRRRRAASRLAGAVALVLLALAPRARADPRWWWDDTPVAPGFDVIDADVAVITEGPLTPLILVVFATRPTFIEGQVELTASFDGGCSFCTPVRIGTVFTANEQVAIAAAPIEGAPQPIVSIAVVHQSGGTIEVLHDSGSITILPGRTDCFPLTAVATNIRSTTLGATGRASDPDVAAITTPGGGVQFHAVWHDINPTSDVIAYANDLVGNGSGWTSAGPIASSGALGPPLGAPRVSLDLFTSAGTGAAVNVAWPVPNLNQVLYLRSVDSGTTFSATGAPPAGAPAIVSQAGLGTSGPVALDSGGTRSTSDPPWHGVLSFQERGPAPLLFFDAQAQQAPTVPSPTWGVDQLLGPGALQSMGIAASIVGGGVAGTPEPAWLFYTTAREISTRGAVLDTSAATPVDLGSPAFPSVRPGDPATSTDEQLSACAIDDATGACVATRTRGNATHPASTDDGTNVFVTWLDDRTGTSEVWFKRTDRSVTAPDPSLTTSCLTATTSRITVSFDQVPGCGATPPQAERIRRYLVYYGTNPAGPYDDTDLTGTVPGVPDTIVIDDDGSLVDPVTVDIDGLPVGTTYFVIVVPEDEARNVDPPDFDPLADGTVSPPSERSITTPVTCGGGGPCLYRATSATLDATGLFISPPAGNDVSFAAPNDVPYATCPFTPGTDDPQPVLDAGMPPLVFYQVEGTTPELHVAKDPVARSVTLMF